MGSHIYCDHDLRHWVATRRKIEQRFDQALRNGQCSRSTGVTDGVTFRRIARVSKAGVGYRICNLLRVLTPHVARDLPRFIEPIKQGCAYEFGGSIDLVSGGPGHDERVEVVAE